MRALAFAGRNLREILRDPLSAVFGVLFPLGLLAVMQTLFHSIPGMPEVFLIQSFGPSMVVFGQTFLMMFLATLTTSDRSGAYLSRLFTTPMCSADFLCGYSLAILPLAILQAALCLGLAAAFGMNLGGNLPAILGVLLADALLFVALGLLFGCAFQSVQLVSGMCSLVINLAAWLSGMWFPLDLVGGGFRAVCQVLPFYHAVQAMKCAASGASPLSSLLWVLGYAAVIAVAAALLFRRRMRGE